MLETLQKDAMLTTRKLVSHGDNQQGSANEAVLAYLGGILDAEGTFYLNRNYSVPRALDGVIIPQVRLPNTDHRMIEWVARAIQNLGVGVHISNHSGNRLGQRPQKVLVVCGIKRMVKFLPQLLPCLNAKFEQAELLLKFSESRLAQKHKAPYLESEKLLVQEVSKLNHSQDVSPIRFSFDSSVAVPRLAALLEGDGSAGIGWNSRRAQMTAHCSLVSTSSRLIAEVIHSLEALEIRHAAYRRGPLGISKKAIAEVRVTSMTQVSKLIGQIRPFLVGEKIERFNLVDEWCQRRLNAKYGSPYTREDWEFFERVRDLNIGGQNRKVVSHPSTTARSQAGRFSRKIQSGLHGDMQSTAETSVPAGGIQ